MKSGGRVGWKKGKEKEVKESSSSKQLFSQRLTARETR
jgi:hypothetical protein